jgi:hypothetical protein
MNLKRYAHAADNHPRPPHRVNGRIRYLLALILVAFGCLTASDSYSKSESAEYKEYEVKAAFIYNFLKFVEWPKEKQTFSPNEITIGVIGQDPFGAAFDVFKDKQVRDCNVVVRRFDSYVKLKDAAGKDKSELSEKIEGLKKCHVLFICDSEKEHVADIIKLVKDHSVLTVADMDGFLEAGGVANFVLEENKIRFQINATASDRAKLEIRSQLLRLAQKVVKQEAASETLQQGKG